MEFDESNGSQEEVVGYENVGDEEIDEALKKMSIGDIKPEEVHEGNDQGGGPSSSTPSTSTAPQMDEDQEKDDTQPQEDVPTPTPQVQEQEEQSVPPQAQNIEPQEDSSSQPQERLTRTSRNHPIDMVMGDPTGGTRTRRRQYTSFCEHYSFVSCLEPSNVDEALEDPDWVMTMQEELNNFTRNEVWILEERPQGKNIIGTKWVFRNKQDEHGVVARNKAR